MLYIFAGAPKCKLHAGGLRRFVEIENIGLLQEDPAVQYRKEGEYIVGANDSNEWIADFDCLISTNLIMTGITWDWFPENWSFGNGVTVHKTTVRYQDNLAVIENNGQVELQIVRQDRSAYEARWLPGTCPKESHDVLLTWLVFKHQLPGHAAARLQAAIEGPNSLSLDHYTEKHFSSTRDLVIPKGKMQVRA